MSKSGHPPIMAIDLRSVAKNPAHAGNLKRYGMIGGSVLTMLQHAEAEGHAHTAKEIAGALPIFPSALIRQALTVLEKQGAAYKWKRGHWRPKAVNPSPGEMKHGPHASAAQRIAERDALEAASAFYGSEKLLTKARKLKGYTAPTAFVDIGDFVSIVYDSDKFDGIKRIYEHEGEVKRKVLMSTDGSTAVFNPPFKLTGRGIEG